MKGSFIAATMANGEIVPASNLRGSSHSLHEPIQYSACIYGFCKCRGIGNVDSDRVGGGGA
jgi:hypothetical protein